MCDCNPIELTKGPKGDKGDKGDTGAQGASGVNGWALDGNTNGAEKSIGTSDNYDFPIIVNASEALRIKTTGKVGIFTTAPSTNLEVAGNDANAIITSTRYQTSATSPSGIVSRKANGTLSVPTAILAGDSIGGVGAAGYHSGGAFGNTSGQGIFTAAENYTLTNRGTNFLLQLAPIGSTAIATILTAYGDARIALVGRLNLSKGSNVTAANDITLGSGGNFFTITGNTQINRLAVANWNAGSQITLLFTGTPTVKNGQATGGGFNILLLAGSVDFVAANNSLLCLIFDGVSWQETSRKVA